MAERPNIFSETYHYLADVSDVDALPVDLPGIESIAVMSGTARKKHPFKALRLDYKRLPEDRDFSEDSDQSSPPDKIGPRAIYCFDEDGSDDLMFLNETLLAMTGRLPEECERVTATSLGFFFAVLTTLHGQYPKLFADPKPLVKKMIGRSL